MHKNVLITSLNSMENTFKHIMTMSAECMGSKEKTRIKTFS